MPSKHSLRFRIGATFFVLSVLLCLVFAWVVELAIDQFEERYVRSTLSGTLDLIIDERRNAPGWPLPSTPTVKAYAVTDGDTGGLPEALAGLQQGYFEYETEENEYVVGVRNDGNVRYVVTYDSSLFDRHEEILQQALIAGVVVFGLMALGLGVWTANRILAPITALARQMRELGGEVEATALDVQWGNDEVAELAVAFEHYMQRVQELVSREREFTANVSHELRTPIMVASSSVELLLAREGVNEDAARRLQRISRALRQMTNLVDAFLILGRESGATSYTEEPIEIESALREIVELRNEAAQAKKLELALVVNATPRVAAPRTVVSVVLDNLVRNALAYTSTGRISVALNDDNVRISDTGRGIPDDERQRVFEREFRGRDTGSRGSGLGLAIVKALCDRYGWRVSVESNDEGGTTAQVRFSF